jgi:hypothetical protein
MSLAKESGRLAWLGAALTQQRRKIGKLINRMSSMGPSGALKPSVFSKFLGLLEQVAIEQKEEIRLLSQIETIEQKHRFLRKDKKLRRARPAVASSIARWHDYPGVKKPSNGGLWWYIIVWYLFSRQKINQKKQALTVD